MEPRSLASSGLTATVVSSACGVESGGGPPQAAVAAAARLVSISGSTSFAMSSRMPCSPAASVPFAPWVDSSGKGVLRGEGVGADIPRNSCRISSSPSSSSMVFLRSEDTSASSLMVGCRERAALPKLLAASARPLGPNTTRATTPAIRASGAPTPKKEAHTCSSPRPFPRPRPIGAAATSFCSRGLTFPSAGARAAIAWPATDPRTPEAALCLGRVCAAQHPLLKAPPPRGPRRTCRAAPSGGRTATACGAICVL
mmetsp:Transcript_35409/g.100266  ORF Transcript_35409/g.100266 Transcript_35409/m.100266 type:complete len:256 (-) Transcript_35409:135-902(-)